MRHILITILFFSIYHNCFSQTWGDSTLKSDPIFYATEIPPMFPGGLSGFYTFVAKHLKAPQNKRANTLARTVTVEIIIDKTGKVAYAEIKSGINETFNLKVIEMVQAMPLWTPATQNNRPVPTWKSLSVTFID
ncbi:energy transducer TonB [Lacibacter sp. H407]|uniref:energy transducer TonB n=1 Tax=Lacibacter sp. H407 TaxID=3133423 RepID=UPI0030C0C3BA